MCFDSNMPGFTLKTLDWPKKACSQKVVAGGGILFEPNPSVCRAKGRCLGIPLGTFWVENLNCKEEVLLIIPLLGKVEKKSNITQT